MRRITFLYVDIKVYPASIEEKNYGANHDWDTLLIAEQPVLATHESIGLEDGYWSTLHEAINNWINGEMRTKGKELIYQNCPKAPK